MTDAEIQSLLCEKLCTDVTVRQHQSGALQIATPFMFADGDGYDIYLRQPQGGTFQLTDMGTTLMHLSYENEVDKLREGTRGKVFKRVLSEMGLQEQGGELLLNSSAEELGSTVVRFGQALTLVHDLSFLSRLRVESTFYEDLREKLERYVPAEKIHPDYIVENVPNGPDYPIDFYIEGAVRPLYLFGVPNRDKARLATIILQHLNAAKMLFESMIVFRNADEATGEILPRPTVVPCQPDIAIVGAGVQQPGTDR